MAELRRVYGIGVNDIPGVTSDKSSLLYRIYVLWHDMLRRCYSQKFHEAKPSYRGVLVCERWHSLSVFAQDLPSVEGYENWVLRETVYVLDKDMRIKGSRLYSLETVKFVTLEDSSREVYERLPELRKEQGKRILDRMSRGVRVVTEEEVVECESFAEAARFLGVNSGRVSECVRKGRILPGVLEISLIGSN